jgi:hypothetical protein
MTLAVVMELGKTLPTSLLGWLGSGGERGTKDLRSTCAVPQYITYLRVLLANMKPSTTTHVFLVRIDISSFWKEFEDLPYSFLIFT